MAGARAGLRDDAARLARDAGRAGRPDARARARPAPRRGEPAMSLAAFAFLMAGVLLNAGAQLLLKAGTNVLGVLTLTRDTWPDTLLQDGDAGLFRAGHRLLRLSRVRLDPRAVARPGVGRLSAAVGRLRRQRDRRATTCSARPSRRRAGSASASSSSASGWSRAAERDRSAMSAPPYLKFAGPVLDEATIAGVGRRAALRLDHERAVGAANSSARSPRSAAAGR